MGSKSPLGPKIAKLVNISSLTPGFMVRSIVFMGVMKYQASYNWGASPCMACTIGRLHPHSDDVGTMFSMDNPCSGHKKSNIIDLHTKRNKLHGFLRLNRLVDFSISPFQRVPEKRGWRPYANGISPERPVFYGDATDKC